jgi:hypothetical protein
MKYRVLGNLHSVGRGDFVAVVENGEIELPEEIANDLIASGEVAPTDTEYPETENNDGGLHHAGGSQTDARKRRKRR